MTKDTTTEIRYTEIGLSHIIEKYVDGLEYVDSEIVLRDWFIDATKGIVIVKLYVEVHP